jgi:ferredoxin/flavodoxin
MSPFPHSTEANNQPKDKSVNALIVYGSSRGTTERIAETIAEGMSSTGASASAISLELIRLVPDRIRTADVLGIGTPVYFLREPRFMTEFVSDLPLLEGKRTFFFCTCGTDRIGETFQRLDRLLSQRGAVVVGARRFRSAMSYFPHRRRGLGNPEHLPDESVLIEAREFGEHMTRAMELDPIELPPASQMIRLKAQLLANKTFRKMLFPGVRVIKKDCTGYGSCLSRCKFKGLDRAEEEEIPFITDNCMQCLECITYCPRSAIVPDSRVKEWLTVAGYHLGVH